MEKGWKKNIFLSYGKLNRRKKQKEKRKQQNDRKLPVQNGENTQTQETHKETKRKYSRLFKLNYHATQQITTIWYFLCKYSNCDDNGWKRKEVRAGNGGKMQVEEGTAACGGEREKGREK